MTENKSRPPGRRTSLVPISEIRRRELCQAAYEVLQTEGVTAATLEKVAAQAGASKGIVLHYFGTKQRLFEQTMRYANALLRDALILRLRDAATPAARIWAVIDTNFDPAFFRPAACHAWLALCAEVPHDPEYRRIQRAIYARMRSNLVSALAPLLPSTEVEEVTMNVTSLIDGYWLRAGLQMGDLTRETALRHTCAYLLRRIPAIGPHMPAGLRAMG
jgi:TetR/AcrR family transcriptional repressor of bet genes